MESENCSAAVFTLDLILPIVFAFLAKLDHSRSNTKHLSFPSLGGGGEGGSDIKTEISIFFEAFLNLAISNSNELTHS